MYSETNPTRVMYFIFSTLLPITASSSDVCSKISEVFSFDKRDFKEKLCFIKLYPLSTEITAT